MSSNTSVVCVAGFDPHVTTIDTLFHQASFQGQQCAADVARRRLTVRMRTVIAMKNESREHEAGVRFDVLARSAVVTTYSPDDVHDPAPITPAECALLKKNVRPVLDHLELSWCGMLGHVSNAQSRGLYMSKTIVAIEQVALRMRMICTLLATKNMTALPGKIWLPEFLIVTQKAN
jgi:hypothetical protein